MQVQVKNEYPWLDVEAVRKIVSERRRYKDQEGPFEQKVQSFIVDFIIFIAEVDQIHDIYREFRRGGSSEHEIATLYPHVQPLLDLYEQLELYSDIAITPETKEQIKHAWRRLIWLRILRDITKERSEMSYPIPTAQ